MRILTTKTTSKFTPLNFKEYRQKASRDNDMDFKKLEKKISFYHSGSEVTCCSKLRKLTIQWVAAELVVTQAGRPQAMQHTVTQAGRPQAKQHRTSGHPSWQTSSYAAYN